MRGFAVMVEGVCGAVVCVYMFVGLCMLVCIGVYSVCIDLMCVCMMYACLFMCMCVWYRAMYAIFPSSHAGFSLRF